ncbi:MAG TPA: peptide chain release factor N(5)-glutamine methyltransferase [Edaphobacter sp.]
MTLRQSIRQTIQSATQRLALDPHLAASARRDAETLALHLLGITRAGLLADPDRELSTAQLDDYEALLARRLQHEPIQYILGTQEFYGLPFRVTPAVLIPRPETEHLVESALERLPHDRPVAIADIGTGSGAIAIALAKHLPQASVTALDLSPSALDVARSNAEALGVSPRLRFVLSDLLSGLPPEEQRGHFDAIVSNPPYIPTTDEPSLHPEVRAYEPHSALFSGKDGLDLYRRLIPAAYDALQPGGLLALEIGHGQREAIASLLEGWHEVGFVDDLQSIPRVVLARK